MLSKFDPFIALLNKYEPFIALMLFWAASTYCEANNPSINGGQMLSYLSLGYYLGFFSNRNKRTKKVEQAKKEMQG